MIGLHRIYLNRRWKTYVQFLVATSPCMICCWCRKRIALASWMARHVNCCMLRD